MSRHQFVQGQTTSEGETERAEKSFPRFLGANVRTHQMPSDCAPGQVSAHIAEFCHRYQKQNVKLAGDDSGARSRSEIKNFGDEIEEPQHIEQNEQSISHSLQRHLVTQTTEHMPGDNRQQKKKQGLE